jgi:hypothetical protein
MAYEAGQADIDGAQLTAWEGAKEALTDYKVWLLALMQASQQLGMGCVPFVIVVLFIF